MQNVFHNVCVHVNTIMCTIPHACALHADSVYNLFQRIVHSVVHYIVHILQYIMCVCMCIQYCTHFFTHARAMHDRVLISNFLQIVHHDHVVYNYTTIFYTTFCKILCIKFCAEHVPAWCALAPFWRLTLSVQAGRGRESYVRVITLSMLLGWIS